MMCGDVEQVIAFVNRIFHALDYKNYTIRDEASFQAFMQIFMIALSLKPQVEGHTSKGHRDMEVETGTYHWVLNLNLRKFLLFEKSVKMLQNKSVDALWQHATWEPTYTRGHGLYREENRQITDWFMF